LDGKKTPSIAASVNILGYRLRGCGEDKRGGGGGSRRRKCSRAHIWQQVVAEVKKRATCGDHRSGTMLKENLNGKKNAVKRGGKKRTVPWQSNLTTQAIERIRKTAYG